MNRDTKLELITLSRRNLTERQLFDLEMILQGGFSPLSGFLTEDEYTHVIEHMRLPSGALWPMPIVLDVNEHHGYTLGQKLVLCDSFGNPVAFFTINSIYSPDKKKEAELVYGTTDVTHPGVRYLTNETGPIYLGGPVELIAYSPKYDFRELRKTPRELKEEFARKGYSSVVAFQTRNPIHRAHFELIREAAERSGAHILLHPVAGLTKEGDIDYITRVRSYKRLRDKRLKEKATLSLLPLAMRMAGPREALWHALIRKNYGATHFIVGRDHAGPGLDSAGKPFYTPYAAQDLAKQYEEDIGLTIVPVHEIAYIAEEDKYIPADKLSPSHKPLMLSGTEFRRMLRSGEAIPEWFSFPEVVEELRRAVVKEQRRGAVVFFTGLSGAGKSTIAHVLYTKLLEVQDRSVTLLDGDVVRQNLSKGLGFSREDRDANIERIGFVANEIAKHGGIAICSAIAPYRAPRERNRHLIEKNGSYVEVYVATPLHVCEERDSKGLYQKARAGLLQHFTGIDDPYETPDKPELIVDTTKTDPLSAADTIIEILVAKNIIALV